MARKTLIDEPAKPAVKTAKAPVKAPKALPYLVTYSRDDGEQHTIPVEAANGPAATAVVEANMPGCEIHSCVIDKEQEQRTVLSDGTGRPARPDPKPSAVKSNRGGVKAAKIAEKAKPALKGKTPSEVAAADKAAVTKPAAKAEKTTAAPAPDTDRAKAKSDLQAQVVKLWKASKEKDAGARRKAIAKELNIPGRVMGILRDAGIDGKQV
jgi:hypothetical protein